MKRDSGAFTIVELVIAISVIAILAAIVTLSYLGVTHATRVAAVKSDLLQVSNAMEAALQHDSAYPATIPSSFTQSNHSTLTVVRSGALPYYTGLEPIQNGVLLSEACDTLIADGVGKGTNGDGEEEDYITWCGNWNDDKMQVTGWNTKTWDTPVEKQTLLDYAQNFTTNNSFHKDQERVVEAFYTQLIALFEQQGGTFPITSFWDYWATPANGGVQKQSLDDADSTNRPYYCIEGEITGAPEERWHITQEEKLREGGC